MSTTVTRYVPLASVLLVGAPTLAMAQTSAGREVLPPIVRESEMPAATRPPLPRDFASSSLALAAMDVSTEGTWIYTAERGYVWIPKLSEAYIIHGIPAAYLYTPELGWAWYASPWGAGPFRYDGWVSRPWTLGFRVLTQGSDGWTWRAPMPEAHVTGRMFGAAGHLYDADGQIVSQRHAVSSRSAHGASSESQHAGNAGRGQARHAEGGHASHR
jgi:hypothetical protein